ncbi:MAG TPA: 2Fe-2S iron-sulfur cluster-binding protein [Myxococcaceae bacterium]|nr:2Fe-2S iron-sulfur cluster-binding protein [Myxococcaceae bacterium]
MSESDGKKPSGDAQPPLAKPPGPPPGPGGKPAPKHPGFVTVTVDGKELVAKPGANMVDAVKAVGSEIPYYCYHPRLSIAANCRMCLVEVSNSPKLVPACQTPMAEGMIIQTRSARVQESQRAVMEMLLLNHPVDCSICDDAGECKLQDYYQRHNHRSSRLEGQKFMKAKRKVLGPTVVLDQERCILCTRCVRFMTEVAKEPQLGMFGRGSAEYIDTFPGKQLDSNYSGNVVDICPVGALLNRDFRFRARSWFLSAAPSVCTGCSRGCSTFVDFMGQDTYRYRPRENEAINKSWMCDQGRLSYKYLNQHRLSAAMLGRGEDRREATVPETLKSVVEQFKALAGTEGLAVLASPLASNEDLLAALALARDALGVRSVYVGGRPDGAGDQYLMRPDKNPNRRGLEWVARGLEVTLKPFAELTQAIAAGKVKALYAIGGEVPVDAAVAAQAFGKLEYFVLQASNESPVTEQAHVLLPAAVHVEDEGTFTNLDGITQRFRRAYPPRADVKAHWAWAVALAQEFGFPWLQTSARDVFREWGSRVAELASLDWDGTAPPLKVTRGLNPLPTGADGRPPGYRELGVPRVRGI